MKQLKMKDIEKHINITQPSFIYYIRQVSAVVDEGPGQGHPKKMHIISFLRKHRVFVAYKHFLYHKNA